MEMHERFEMAAELARGFRSFQIQDPTKSCFESVIRMACMTLQEGRPVEPTLIVEAESLGFVLHFGSLCGSLEGKRFVRRCAEEMVRNLRMYGGEPRQALWIMEGWKSLANHPGRQEVLLVVRETPHSRSCSMHAINRIDGRVTLSDPEDMGWMDGVFAGLLCKEKPN